MIDNTDEPAPAELPRQFLVQLTHAELLVLLNGTNYAVMTSELSQAGSKYIDPATIALGILALVAVKDAAGRLGPGGWATLVDKLTRLLDSSGETLGAVTGSAGGIIGAAGSKAFVELVEQFRKANEKKD